MKINQLKLLVVLFTTILLLTVTAINFNYNKVEATANADEETITLYKAKCMACHGADAAKKYNAEIALEEQVQAILKGKKAEKPPNMPAYEEKGIDEAKATALAEYMKNLRTPKTDQ